MSIKELFWWVVIMPFVAVATVAIMAGLWWMVAYVIGSGLVAAGLCVS